MDGKIGMGQLVVVRGVTVEGPNGDRSYGPARFLRFFLGDELHVLASPGLGGWHRSQCEAARDGGDIVDAEFDYFISARDLDGVRSRVEARTSQHVGAVEHYADSTNPAFRRLVAK